MGENARKEKFELVELFGKPALFTNNRIDRYTVPHGLYCYDLRGSDRDPGQPVTVEPQVGVNHAGAVITAKKLSFGERNYLALKDGLNFLGENTTLDEFVNQNHLKVEYPKYELCAADISQQALYFCNSKEDDAARGCIGHLRMDFGRSGDEFWHSWFDHLGELNKEPFKSELQEIINEIRKGPLKDFNSMSAFCWGHSQARLYQEDSYRDDHGFKVETEGFQYFFRFLPHKGDYNAYCLCFDKSAQQINMDEQVGDMDQQMRGL